MSHHERRFARVTSLVRSLMVILCAALMPCLCFAQEASSPAATTASPTPAATGALSGIWQVYPRGVMGSVTVTIRQTGDRIEGTIVGGDSSLTSHVPAGKLMFYGTYNPSGFKAQNICAGMNYTDPHWVPVIFSVIDNDHMQEDYTGPFYAGCVGFPLTWERAQESAPSHSSPPSTTGCTITAPPQSSGKASVPVTIPAGTVIPIRMIDSIDSSKNQVGQQFTASVGSPVIVGDHVAIPQDAYAWVQLVQAKSAGHIVGRSELQLELVSVRSEGMCYDAVSSTYKVKGTSRGKQSAKRIGGAAALGAIIGVFTHGAKGAAVGGAIGAGAATAVQVLTHGPKVRVPSETLIDFTLQTPVTVMLKP